MNLRKLKEKNGPIKATEGRLYQVYANHIREDSDWCIFHGPTRIAVLEPRSFEDKEINELVKKLQLNLCFLFIDRASYCNIFYNLVPELEKKIDELKNENIKIKTENTKLKHDKKEVETENIKLKQDLDKFKKN
ncbi:24628_t:CDS:2 [Gigaspora margarita]|uniref:24628_t:CDS:1 n=1 Tax=Gigaspora margarita TaxID=4874 RepID=A0ABN7WES5_GIGMA|nr:24628_t:CDS:2 [Gigaspora margarita]